MHRQPVAQLPSRHGARRAPQDRAAAPAVPLRRQRASRRGAARRRRERARDIDRAALAGARGLDRMILGVQPAHPHRDPRGLSVSRSPTATAPAATVPVTTSPIPGRVKARSIAMRNRPAGGAVGAGIASASPGCVLQMAGQRRDAVAGAARHREDRALGIAGCGEQRRDLGDNGRAALGSGAVDLGDDAGDLGNPDQLENVEMLDRLRARPVIGGDDQQHPVDRQHARQHVRTETARDRGHRQSRVRRHRAKSHRQNRGRSSARAVFPRAGDRHRPRSVPDQRGLAVIDMAGGREDHRGTRSAMRPIARRNRPRLPGSANRARDCRLRYGRSPGSARRARRAPASRPPPQTFRMPIGRNAKAALGNSETGRAPLPIWLRVSINLDFGDPCEYLRAAAGSRRRASALRSRLCGRDSSRNAGSRAASRSGSA